MMSPSTEIDDRPASAGVIFPPPLLFVSGVVFGWAARRLLAPLPFRAGGVPVWMEVVAAVLLAAGVLLAWWGILTFLLANTAIIPHHPATRLVRHGPYRFSRNPMYVGLTMAYVGFAVLVNDWWTLLFLPFVLAALWFLVIRKEERYLRATFGDDYAEYCGRVRRFI